MNVNGDAAAVVHDRDAVVLSDGDGDSGTVTRQNLVNAVVHSLKDKVMQSGGTGTAYVHTGPLSHTLKALQNLYLFCVVTVFFLHYFHFLF
jgi:hypothetical protein